MVIKDLKEQLLHTPKNAAVERTAAQIAEAEA